MATLRNGSFYGTAARPLRLDDLVLTETSYAPGFVVPLHTHEQPLFCLPVAGAFVEQVDAAKRTLQRRSAFFHPAAHVHGETFEHGAARLFNIQFGTGWLARLQPFAVTLPTEHVPVDGGRIPALGLLLYDEYRLHGERLVVDGLLLAMLGELSRWRRTRERHGAPRWLDDVVAALRAHSPGDIGVAELAAIAQVHPAHLARTFRAAHGCTIGEYARRLRIARARELITTTDLPLARIAFECGFADQSHFTRVFRREVGATPAAYRRAVRPG